MKNYSLKFKIVFAVVILFAVFLLPKISQAATYYVATNGSNSNPGTQVAPWLTIQHAADSVAAGDTVIVVSGSYNERVMITENGSSGNYITFKSVPTRTATAKGFDINGQYIRVEGFNVTNPGDTCDNDTVACINGIAINASYAQVVNNYVYNWRGASAIGVPDPLTWVTRPSSAYVANNLIYHSQMGIGVWGDGWTVTGNEVNRLWAYTFEGGWDCDYLRAWGIGVTITNNYFHGTILSEVVNPSSGLHAHVDCLQTWSYHSGVLQNLLYNINWCSEYHEMMVQGTNSNLTISNSVFANALVTDEGHLGGGLNVQGTNDSTQIGNTFYNGLTGPGCSDGSLPTLSTNCIARNNIVYNASCGTYCNYAWQLLDSSDTEDHNLAYRAEGSIYNVFLGRTSDVFDVTDKPNQNPLFVNTSNIVGADGISFTADDGLMLQSGSPARGKGYGGVDIGAYEYVGAGDTTPPAAPTGITVN